jgi:hypothetical protein
VADFASDDWIGERARRLAAIEVDPALTLRIEQWIDDAAAWTITVAGGRASMTAGAVGEPDIRLLADATTAEAIHRGSLSAQRAFLDGTLRIGGDVSPLLEHRRALAAVTTALGAADTGRSDDSPSAGGPPAT